MRILFACGGTGGHINPALAVARLIKERKPSSEILFVGSSGGMETRLVPNAGFSIKTIKASSVSRKKNLRGLLDNIKTVKNVLKASKDVRKIIEEFSPDIVMGTGGYVCYPVLATASKMKVPTILHEANALPGLATRKLWKKVSRMLLNFEASKEKMASGVASTVVGNPIRGDILMYDRETARQELGITKPLLVSFWGSLGARDMNEKIAEFIKLESENRGEFCHIHACGSFGYSWMPQLVEKLGVDLSENPDITLREYIDDMPRVLAAADVVMCRAGAGTLSEVSARGVPAIIVPSPNVTDNHQYKNAMEMQKLGGAIVFEEKDVTPKLLFDTARKLLFDKEKRKEMSKKLTDSAVLDATERIYSEILDIIRK